MNERRYDFLRKTKDKKLHELYVKLWNSGGEQTPQFKKIQKEIEEYRRKKQ